ncbi:MAG TPA: OsmC family protein [Candidatus Eisenbacteria bacterium]
MAEYRAVTEWRCGDQPFIDNRYSRAHRWTFDEGVSVTASASPLHVPLPLSVGAAVDPEEAFVASLSSCHLLTYLYLAAKKGFRVESYRDEAVGRMEKGEDGGLWMSVVTLRPVVTFGGDRRPSAAEAEALHHDAHAECYIARSVRSEVRCEATSLGVA